jgi:small-conductance mechanosensitive channel
VAGLYLLADRPVRAGDYIKLHDGEEGYVEAIGWRSTRLRTQKSNIVIVPNQKLSQAVMTNYHLPSPLVIASASVTVSYDADAAAVEAALREEMTRAAAEIKEIHTGPDVNTPVVRLTDLADSGMVFQCFFHVTDFDAQFLAAHEVRKRIVARLRRDGVAIALAQRVLQGKI